MREVFTMKLSLYKLYKNNILIGKDYSLHDAVQRASGFSPENVYIEKAIYNTRDCSEAHITKIINPRV